MATRIFLCQTISRSPPRLGYLPWSPSRLFTRTGLSYFAGTIGEPLYLDKATENLSRVDLAKVCIEVNILENLPDCITLAFDDSPDLKVQVEYPWCPLICEGCGAIGHPKSLCPSSPIPSKPSRPIQSAQTTIDQLASIPDPSTSLPIPSPSRIPSAQDNPSTENSAPSSVSPKPIPIPPSETNPPPPLAIPSTSPSSLAPDPNSPVSLPLIA